MCYYLFTNPYFFMSCEAEFQSKGISQSLVDILSGCYNLTTNIEQVLIRLR